MSGYVITAWKPGDEAVNETISGYCNAKNRVKFLESQGYVVTKKYRR